MRPLMMAVLASHDVCMCMFVAYIYFCFKAQFLISTDLFWASQRKEMKQKDR